MKQAVRRLVGLAMLLATLMAGEAAAKVFITVDESLKLAFPACTVTRHTVYLTPAQKAEAERLSGVPLSSNVVFPYRAVCQGKPAGTVWFDASRVRTLPQTLMIAVDAAARVLRVEVLAFGEPEDYIPRGAWYAQFVGKALGPELDLKGEIRPVAGATLTTRATTAAVRRVLALHKVVGD
jgi:hypothetical protein